MHVGTPRLLILAIFAALTLALAACGPGPKPQPLVELERILQDPAANEVKEAPGASKPYREARQYRRLSLEAWEDGKEELSQEYAILGSLKYRTAAAIKDQVEAKARLDAANAKVGESNPEISALNQERNKLVAEVDELQRHVSIARRTQEEAERRQSARSQQDQMRQSGDSDSLRLALNSRLAEVEKARQAAREVDAAAHAPASFNRADNTLKSLRTMLASGTSATEQMLSQANEALQLFEQARSEAAPKAREATEKADPAARRAAIQEEARSIFGGPYTVSEPNGVRVVLASLFNQGDASIRPQSQVLLDELAELAQKYDEFRIYIEGYTSTKGNATENLGTSQVRARAVESFLTGKGVAASRIETSGAGQERPRFPGEPGKNERVEIVFSRTN